MDGRGAPGHRDAAAVSHTEAGFPRCPEEAELVTGGSFQKYIWADWEHMV